MRFVIRLGHRCVGLGLLISALAVMGCGQSSGRSGFLGEYSQLHANPDLEGVQIYSNTQQPLQLYHKFIVEPVVLHYAPSADGVTVNLEDAKIISDYAYSQLVQCLAGKFKYVSAPGHGVLRIRIAITGIDYARHTIDDDPMMRESRIRLAGASMEADVVDSITGERIFAMVDQRYGESTGSLSDFGEYAYTKQAIKFWVKQFFDRVYATHQSG